ncbi:MAG: pyrroloquinoline quinone biosynthesis protein PqqE [Pseudomonadota bacterium]
MTARDAVEAVPVPMAMLAELTHRCPLKCPYCSNPIDLIRRSRELDAATWIDVFQQAARLGVLHVHLSGGEPVARADLEALTEGARDAGLYTNLITSGVGLTRERLTQLAEIGLDHVQLSLQGADAASADEIGGHPGAFETKLQVAGWTTALGLPLTVIAVTHRRTLDRIDDMIALAERLGARRLEIAHVQLHGWAARNREALTPTRAQVKRAGEAVRAARERLAGRMAIDYVTPDLHASYPKACMGGWGRLGFCVTPEGKVLPCHAAETIPSLSFETVHDRPLAEIWADGPAFAAYRGVAWMPEPCASCDRRTRDWGGCRCQAFALTGDAGATDPVCSKSPLRAGVVDPLLADAEGADATPPYVYRAYGPAGL